MAEQPNDFGDLTPAQVDQRMRWLHDEIGRGGKLLREAIKEQGTAKAEWISANAAAELHPDCPRVGVEAEDGMRITVSYRNAWIYQHTEPYVRALDAAKARVQAGRVYMQELRGQLTSMQSVGASLRESYRAYGHVR